MESATGWSELVRSIEKSRANGAKFFKPVCLIGAIDLADEGKLDPIDVDAEAILRRFDSYVRPHFSSRGRSGWQPLWYLSNNGLWSFLKHGKVIRGRDFNRFGRPHSRAGLLAAFDRLVISAPLRPLWNNPEQRRRLRTELVMMLASDSELASRTFARALYDPAVMLQPDRWPSEDQLQGQLRVHRQQLDLFEPSQPSDQNAKSSAVLMAVLRRPVTDLKASDLVTRSLSSGGYPRVGDVATAKLDELYALQLSEKTVRVSIGRGLRALGLELGMAIPGWPPEADPVVPDLSVVASRLRDAVQDPYGVQFAESEDEIFISQQVDERDLAAAKSPLTQQLHAESLRKLVVFADHAIRLDNQPGWGGVDALCKRLLQTLSCSTEDVPAVIGEVYSAALELGSYLELDNDIRGSSASSVDALEAEVRRGLLDLIRTFAPWVRRFPSAQQADDETGKFLGRAPLLATAESALEFARLAKLLPDSDADALMGLFDAARRGDSVGQKAGARGLLSTRNIVVLAGCIIAHFYIDAASSDFATKSPVVQRAGSFFQAAEREVLELVKDLPADLRIAVESLIRHGPHEPFLRSDPPTLQSTRRRQR